MELPDDFADRVRRLKHPGTVVRKALQALEEAERGERLQARLRDVQDAWAALAPDLRQRYLEAMGKFPYLLVQPLEPGVDAYEDVLARVREMRQEPNAADAPWVDREARQKEERRRKRQQEHEELLERLVAAGLPYRPELVYPTEDADSRSA